MNIQPYDRVTNGRRTGIVMAIRGGLAMVSFPPTKPVPPEWTELMRSIELEPLAELRPTTLPRAA